MALNLLLKRSNTADKRPDYTLMTFGELNLNYAGYSGGLFYKDSSGFVVKVGPAEVGTTQPNSTPAGSAGNSPGEFWWDTSTTPGILKIFNGTSWVETGAAYISDSVLTAKGDLISASAASTPVVIGVGTNGQILAANSATASGLEWIDNQVGTVTSVTAGTGLDGGTITTTGTIGLADTSVTPGTYTYSTFTVDQQGRLTSASSGTDPVTSVSGTAPVQVTGTTTPTISVDAASTSAAGIVQLYNALDSTSTTLALTAAQGKALQDEIDALAATSNLTFAGTLDASTGLLVTVSTAGSSAGFTAGSALPSAAPGNAEYFVIVEVGGTYTPPGGSSTLTHQGDWFLSNGTSWDFLDVGYNATYASETVPGLIELATNAEVQTGTDATRAVTPAGLQSKTASTTALGLVELATDAETQAGADAARAVTPASLQSKVSNSVTTVSSTTVASSTAVKDAYDAGILGQSDAAAAQATADAAMPKAGGIFTGNVDFEASQLFTATSSTEFATGSTVTLNATTQVEGDFTVSGAGSFAVSATTADFVNGSVVSIDNTSSLSIDASPTWSPSVTVGPALQVSYDNTSSGLTATEVQGAIDEVNVTANSAIANAFTAKGEIIVGTGASALVYLPVGSNDQIILADSTCAAGIKWGDRCVGTVTSVGTGTGLTGGPVTTTGTIALADTTVAPGSYTYSSITVDQQGRLTAASDGTAPITCLDIQAKGDLITGFGVNSYGILSVGTDGQYLIADSTCSQGMKWGDSDSLACSLITAKGDILVGVSASTATALAVGPNDYVLTANSACAGGVEWAAAPPPAGAVAEAAYTTKGDILAASAPSTPVALPVGTDGQVLIADSTCSTGLTWGDAPGGATYFCEISASETWVCPANICFFFIEAIGGGGGGGSGAAGPTATGRAGGGGGTGGVYAYRMMPGSALPATVDVTIGNGGAGAVGVTGTDTGNTGFGGQATFFGDFLGARPGRGGFRGTTTACALKDVTWVGVAVSGWTSGFGSATSLSTSCDGGVAAIGPGGGGSGGALTTGNLCRVGGDGGLGFALNVRNTSLSLTSTVDQLCGYGATGGQLVSGDCTGAAGAYGSGSGGGGGASALTAATGAGAGGVGGWPGGGGGGGGAACCSSSIGSGAGGNGASGGVRIYGW